LAIPPAGPESTGRCNGGPREWARRDQPRPVSSPAVCIVVGQPFDLRAVEERILEQTHNLSEMMVALDEHGQTTFSKIGEPDQIGLTAAEWDLLADATDTLVHNHPSGGGLGVADFSVAVALGIREIVAFGTEYRYRLSRRGSVWPEISETLPLLGEIQIRVCARLKTRVEAGSLSPGEASLRFWHDVWSHVARQLAGIDYTRERR
jgi:hypothetical protein